MQLSPISFVHEYMKYIIYSLVQPEHLQKTIPDGYHYKQLVRSVLEELDETGIESKHDSMEAAVAEITKNAENLKYFKLTILPVINIDYEGKISDF